MIEKLVEQKLTIAGKEYIYPDITAIVGKFNEIIDVVNVLQAQVAILQEHAHPTATTEPADPYAEQRKWIGCLVEYGDADDGFRYGILTNIEPQYSAYPFEIDNGRDATADCWLPSKTIFYKDGDNE